MCTKLAFIVQASAAEKFATLVGLSNYNDSDVDTRSFSRPGNLSSKLIRSDAIDPTRLMTPSVALACNSKATKIINSSRWKLNTFNYLVELRNFSHL